MDWEKCKTIHVYTFSYLFSKYIKKKKKKKEHLPLSQPHLPEVTIREHQWFIPQPHSSPPIPSTLLAPLKTYGWKMFCFGNILYTLLLPISQSKEIKIWSYLGAVIYANQHPSWHHGNFRNRPFWEGWGSIGGLLILSSDFYHLKIFDQRVLLHLLRPF